MKQKKKRNALFIQLFSAKQSPGAKTNAPFGQLQKIAHAIQIKKLNGITR